MGALPHSRRERLGIPSVMTSPHSHHWLVAIIMGAVRIES